MILSETTVKQASKKCKHRLEVLGVMNLNHQG